MSLIEVNNLHKTFKVYKHHRGLTGAVRNLFSREAKEIHAVNDVSFAIEKGDLVGYLGPNGAGKSTTIKMLTGLLVPTSGTVSVAGRVPWQQRIPHTRNIGVVFGQRTNLWWDLPVIESLDLLHHIYEVPHDRYLQNLKIFTDLLEMEPFINTPVRSLSLGQRMRADIAAALLHDPQIVFLDEPTIGLDVVAKDRIRSFIKQMDQEREITTILTTHDLGDVEKLSERIIMIDHGQVVYDGHLEDLRARFGGGRRLTIDFAETYPDVTVPHTELLSFEGKRAVYRFERQKIGASALIGQIAAKFQIADLTVAEPETEDIVRRIYEEKLLMTEPELVAA